MEAHPDKMRAAEELCHNACPGIRTRSLSHSYNCFGMVFANRRTCIVDWTDVQLVLDEDDFHTLPWDPAAWERGDIVLYRKEHEAEIHHVALIADLRPDFAEAAIEVWVVSAWGDFGEYFHQIDDVPLSCGTPSQVVSQRVSV